MVRPPSGNPRRVLREVGAHVGEQLDPHGEELAVLVHRHLGGREVVAAVAVDEEMLAALADPLHRPAELLRRDRGQRILVIAKLFVPKPPPTSGVITRILLAGDVEDVLGDAVAHAVAALGAHGQRVAVGARVVFGDDAARLHVVGDEAVVDDLDLRDPRRLGEGLVGRLARAAGGLEGEVGAVFGPDQRRALASAAFISTTTGSGS